MEGLATEDHVDVGEVAWLGGNDVDGGDGGEGGEGGACGLDGCDEGDGEGDDGGVGGVGCEGAGAGEWEIGVDKGFVAGEDGAGHEGGS